MRTEDYKKNDGNRYWWWRIPGVSHDPLVNLLFTEEENALLDEWYRKTDEDGLIGECAPPLGSFLIGFILGNSVDRIVQLGHYSGYSTITIGGCFKHMGKGKLFSIDI